MEKSPLENPDLRPNYRPLGKSLGEERVGARADSYLSEHFPFLSRSEWQKRMRDGMLLVNWRKVRPSYKIKTGDTLHFYHPQVAEPAVDTGIYPIWRQGAVLAVYKPANLPMHENGPYRFNTFSNLVTKHFGSEWAAVHRLDRETSGIVICGGNYEARKILSQAWFKSQVEKEYLAIAQGRAKERIFRECGPIGDLTESAIRIKKWVVPGGLDAETWFEAVATKENHTLLRAVPKTGRTNQIRIHAAFNGLPLVGDKLYHPEEEVFLSIFENGMTDDIARRLGFHRLCLHAHRLRFTHPETKSICEVECPLPEELQALWDSLPVSPP